MIVLVKTDNGERTTSINCLDTYIEELQFFHDVATKLRNFHNDILKEKSPSVRSYFNRTGDTIIWRMIDRGYTLDTLVILNSGGDLLKKEWVFEDEMVENRQGGTTHNQGWILSGVAD